MPPHGGNYNHGKAQFKDEWLEEGDTNGDERNECSMCTFKCIWCQSGEFYVDNLGKVAMVQYAK